MHLVIVESPSKAKTIEKYLGKDYKVIASKGHIVDLPKSEMGIDIEHKFKPKYVVSKPDSLKNLKKYFTEADSLILAVDPDREGEAIGWHVAVQLKVINDKGSIINRAKGVKRIVFTEITKEAIQEAVKHPRAIDMSLVNAQQARRILDRIVGYKLSPLLWKKIRFGLSAGRVQSVAVRLIVDRERERDAFKSNEYWSLSVYADPESRKQPQIKIIKKDEEKTYPETALVFELVKIKDKKPELTKQQQVDAIIKHVIGKTWTVSELEKKTVQRFPSPPFTTSSMQQAASNRFGMSAKDTMRVAQKLYESGYITYMRTDSPYMAEIAIDHARSYIKKEWGENYLPAQARHYKASAKNSQEAHEAIRPSDFKRLAKDLPVDEKHKKLYHLIWQRALASQMSEARVEASLIRVVIDDYLFQANGQRILFPGFLKVYPQHFSEQILPEMQQGQTVHPEVYWGEQHFTEPPARFTEASLIKALESYGIGRPSTYAPIISTIMARGYVEKINKYLQPTDTANVVTSLLEKHFSNIVDTDFTAEVEEELDLVADGKLDWVKMLSDFYKPFEKNLEQKEKQIKREDYTTLGKSDKKCPICGKATVIKLGRYGRFLSCVDFPKCKGMMSMDGETEADVAKEASSTKFLNVYKPSPKTEDKRDFILKRGKYGRFWAHPDYPKVKDARPLEYTDEIFKKIYGKTPKSKDGVAMILRSGRFGQFWAHPNYPDKKEVIRLDAKKVKAAKEELGIE